MNLPLDVFVSAILFGITFGNWLFNRPPIYTVEVSSLSTALKASAKAYARNEAALNKQRRRVAKALDKWNRLGV